jgi:hypothetical protein
MWKKRKPGRGFSAAQNDLAMSTVTLGRRASMNNITDLATVLAGVAGLWAIAVAWLTYIMMTRGESKRLSESLKSLVVKKAVTGYVFPIFLFKRRLSPRLRRLHRRDSLLHLSREVRRDAEHPLNHHQLPTGAENGTASLVLSDAPTQLGGKFVHCPEIVRRQFRVVIEDLLFGHASGEPVQHIPYSNSQSADTRLASAFARLDRDAGSHASRISLAM